MAELLANSTVGGKVIETVDGMQTRIDSGMRSVKADVSGLNREVAYLKLKQAAKDRIEGGTVFADDFNGNRFGFELDESRSSNIKINSGKMLMSNVEATEIAAIDNTVINQSYSTASNGGRKLVRLANGWLITALYDAIAHTIFVYRSTDDGATWAELTKIYYDTTSTNYGDIALANYGNMVYLLTTVLDSSKGMKNAVFFEFDAVTTLPYILGSKGKNLDGAQQSALGNVSLAINQQGTEIHAAWSTKNSTYPSFNIKHAKGTVNSDGSISWDKASQVTGEDATYVSNQNPSIAVNAEGNPVILYERSGTQSNGFINAMIYTTKWTKYTVYTSGAIAYQQTNPSAIFVPKEINGLPNGRIWVAWHGFDGTDGAKPNIRVSYSDDNGITWSTSQKLTVGNTSTQRLPSITANRQNELFITFEGNVQADAVPTLRVRQLKYTNGTWGTATDVTGAETRNPSSLFDPLFQFDFSNPLTVYQNVTLAKVGFFGNWTALKETPKTTATAIYNIPSTDYVAAAVAKAGGVSVAAYLNDALMNAKLEGNEYIFEGSLGADAPATLRLELTRPTIANGDNDALVRILGGRN